MATINNLENGFNKVQINFSQDKTADGKVIKQSLMINIREDSVQKAYALYQELLRKIENGEEKPKKKIKKEKDEVEKKLEGIETPTCECGSPMILRNGKFGAFYSCASYPLCRLTKPFASEEKKKKIEFMPDQVFDVERVPF